MEQVPGPSDYWLTRAEASSLMKVHPPNMAKYADRYAITTDLSLGGYVVYLRADVERAAKLLEAKRVAA